MNVLFITHYADLYGANRSLLAFFDGLKRDRVRPFVLLPKSGDMEIELSKRDISYLKFPFKNWMAQSYYKLPYRLANNLLATPALLWKLRNLELDLVHTNSSVTPIGAWLAKILGLPHIWHVREFGWDDYRLKYDLGRKQFEYWMNEANHIITVSKSLQDKVLKNITTPSTVIYNGVISQEKAKNLNTSGQKRYQKNKVFGIIGKLSAEKGQEEAILAFKKLAEKFSNTKLLIAGSGIADYEIYLKNLSKDLKLDRQVEFLGFVEDPFLFLSKIDVALICSKNEGMGRVTAEAIRLQSQADACFSVNSDMGRSISEMNMENQSSQIIHTL